MYAVAHRREHVEAALDAAGLHRKPMPEPEASVFADLSGYTKTTDELGDQAAAQLALSPWRRSCRTWRSVTMVGS
jgi:class 3 adenylate cyclase